MNTLPEAHREELKGAPWMLVAHTPIPEDDDYPLFRNATTASTGTSYSSQADSRVAAVRPPAEAPPETPPVTYYCKFYTSEGSYSCLVASSTFARVWIAHYSEARIHRSAKTQLPNLEIGAGDLCRMIASALEGEGDEAKVSVAGEKPLLMTILCSLKLPDTVSLPLRWTIELQDLQEFGGGGQAEVLHQLVIQPMAGVSHALSCIVDLYQRTILAKDRELRAYREVHGPLHGKKMSPMFHPDSFLHEFLKSEDLQRVLSQSNLDMRSKDGCPTLIRRLYQIHASKGSAVPGAAPLKHLLDSPPTLGTEDPLPHRSISPSSKRPRMDAVPPPEMPMEGRVPSYVETAEERARKDLLSQKMAPPPLTQTLQKKIKKAFK